MDHLMAVVRACSATAMLVATDESGSYATRFLFRLWLAAYALTMLAALADATCWSATTNSAG